MTDFAEVAREWDEHAPNRIFAELVNRSGERFRNIEAPGLLDLPEELRITGFSLRGFRRKDDEA